MAFLDAGEFLVQLELVELASSCPEVEAVRMRSSDPRGFARQCSRGAAEVRLPTLGAVASEVLAGLAVKERQRRRATPWCCRARRLLRCKDPALFMSQLAPA